MGGGEVDKWVATILGLVTAFAFYWIGRWAEKIIAARAAYRKAKESVPILRRLFWAGVRASIMTMAIGAGLVFLMGIFAVNGNPPTSPGPTPSVPAQPVKTPR